MCTNIYTHHLNQAPQHHLHTAEAPDAKAQSHTLPCLVERCSSTANGLDAHGFSLYHLTAISFFSSYRNTALLRSMHEATIPTS
jgi:hypothetical protein